MNPRTWKVGELVKQTGLSVRTLHFYEEIGLLRPSERTPAGHRLYTEADIFRLQRIVSLRRLGFSLEDIGACLEQPEFAVAPLIKLHLAKLKEQIVRQQRLYRRLELLRDRLDAQEPIPVTQILETLEAITMLDNYLTPEQIKSLEQRRAQYVAEHGSEGPNEFAAVMAALKTHMAAGDDPASPAVQVLAARHKAFRAATTGDDPTIMSGLRQMLQENAEVREQLGLDEATEAYLAKACAAAGS